MRKSKKKRYNFIALDYAMNRPGICLTDLTQPQSFRCFSYDTPDKNKYDHRISRFHDYGDILINEIPYIISTTRTVIMLEDYAAGAKGRTNEIAECTGILKYKLIVEHGVHPSQIWLCHISHLKMFVSMKGNSKKELILKEVYKKWGLDTDDNNEADAFVMWKILRALYNPDPTITKYQKEILKKIRDFNGR